MEKKSFVDLVYLGLASLLGIGYTPFIPGTASCLAALLVFFLVKNSFYFLLVSLFSLVIAFAVSTRAENIYAEKDCKKIVVDDFSGQLIALLFIPRRLEFIIAAFFIFRMLDMIKIPPADRIEKLSGARGVVGDDLIAGCYANLVLQSARLLLKIFS